MSNPYQVHATDPERAASPTTGALEPRAYPSLEDALFQAFLMLDAGQVVWSITGPDVAFTREQIKRRWRAARQ